MTMNNLGDLPTSLSVSTQPEREVGDVNLCLQVSLGSACLCREHLAVLGVSQALWAAMDRFLPCLLTLESKSCARCGPVLSTQDGGGTA